MTTKLLSNRSVAYLKSIAPSFIPVVLTGGAIPDILSGREPKDYDLAVPKSDYHRGHLKDAIKYFKEKHKFTEINKTSYATTLVKGSMVIQLLEQPAEDVGEFTVSNCTYNFREDTLTVDEDCLDNKLLIPKSVSTVEECMNCLSRIPHWRKKGYNISDEIYFSILNNLNSHIKKARVIYKYPICS